MKYNGIRETIRTNTYPGFRYAPSRLAELMTEPIGLRMTLLWRRKKWSHYPLASLRTPKSSDRLLEFFVRVLSLLAERNTSDIDRYREK